MISNDNTNNVVYGTGGADTIYNGSAGSTIYAGAGNDTVFYDSWYGTINGGDGDDSITAWGKSYMSVNGGAGNDTIVGSDEFGEMFLFSSADGDNVITNFGVEDTLRLTAGNIQNYYASDNDYVINVKGTKYSGSVTLQNVGSIRVSGRSVTATQVNAQLPADDYWFEKEREDDPLSSIITKECAVELSEEPISELLKRSTIELTASARLDKKRDE